MESTREDAGPVPRMFIPTDHSDLRVTWHRHQGAVVLSLWKGDTCTGSAHLSGGDAAELAGFLVAHLGAVVRATEEGRHS